MEGAISNADISNNAIGAIPGGGDPGMIGGGTYTMPSGDNRKDPTIQDYENIFGPAARDIRTDIQRNKRHSRWHLPDALKVCVRVCVWVHCISEYLTIESNAK